MLLRASPKIRPPAASGSQRAWAFDSIERAAKFIQNLVIIFGIFGGAISLVYAQHDKRLDRTVGFTREYNSSARKSYLSLMTAWNKYAKENNFYDHSEQEQENLVIAFFGKNTGEDKIKEKSRDENLEDVLDFYDTLYICVDRSSCDRNSALDFFHPSITPLFETVAYYIFERRCAERDPSVGRGLEGMYYMEPEPWWSRYFWSLPASSSGTASEGKCILGHWIRAGGGRKSENIYFTAKHASP
jgi:hypothetical protein